MDITRLETDDLNGSYYTISESRLSFIRRWHSVVSVCTAMSLSCSNIDGRRVRISASFGNCNPAMKMRHLNWSSVSDFSWKFSPCKFTFPAYAKKSSLSSFFNFKQSSSSSCRAGSTDIPDPLSPRLPVVHRLWQVFWTISCILT